MKAKLIFDVPEERKAFMAAAKADDMAIVLWEITYNLRREVVDHFDMIATREDVTADDVGYNAVIEYIFNQIRESMDNEGIIIDDLIE